MLPDSSYLLSCLNLETPLIGFYDVDDFSAFEPIVKTKKCIFSAYDNWKNGESVCLEKGTSPCPGGSYWVGNKEFLTPSKFADFLYEKEGLKASHEITAQWLATQKPYDIKKKYVVLSQLRDAHYDDLQTITFFVTIDQLSMLLIGADYYNSSPTSNLVKHFFGSGCGQLAAIFNDSPKDKPQAFIGGTDIAMRGYVPANIISFTANKAMYEQLCSLDEKSFLNKHFAQRLKVAREQQV